MPVKVQLYVYEKKRIGDNTNFSFVLNELLTEDFGVRNGINEASARGRKTALQNQLGNNYKVKVVSYQNDQPDLIRLPCEFI